MKRQVHSALVAEDDDGVRDALVDVLSSERWDVVSVVNGADALSLLRDGLTPDIVIADQFMPRMTGSELFREMNKDPTLSTIPFILISSRLGTPADSGVAIMLHKPFELDHLLATLDRVLRGEGAAVHQ